MQLAPVVALHGVVLHQLNQVCLTFLSVSTTSFTFLELGELATIDCMIIVCDSTSPMLLSFTTSSLLSFFRAVGDYSSEDEESSVGFSRSRVARRESETAVMMFSKSSEWNSKA